MTPNRELERILEDNSSGSHSILLNINEWLLNNMERLLSEPKLINEIKERLSHFPAISAYIDQVQTFLSEKNLDEPEEFFHTIARAISRKYLSLANQLHKRGHSLKRIVTLSNSSTVLGTLKELNKISPIKLITVSESRPIMEGRIMAEAFAKEGIKTKLVTESMLPDEVAECDATIIGCDAILADGAIVNKTGSKLLAILCEHYGKPLYVLGEISKQTTDFQYTQPEQSPSEIWPDAPKEVAITNKYFEVVKSKAITILLP